MQKNDVLQRCDVCEGMLHIGALIGTTQLGHLCEKCFAFEKTPFQVGIYSAGLEMNEFSTVARDRMRRNIKKLARMKKKNKVLQGEK